MILSYPVSGCEIFLRTTVVIIINSLFTLFYFIDINYKIFFILDIIKNNINELTTNINSNKIAYGQTSGSARSPESINKFIFILTRFGWEIAILPNVAKKGHFLKIEKNGQNIKFFYFLYSYRVLRFKLH